MIASHPFFDLFEHNGTEHSCDWRLVQGTLEWPKATEWRPPQLKPKSKWHYETLRVFRPDAPDDHRPPPF